MAGTIIADYIRTDANKLSLNVGNTTFATINAMGLLSSTGVQIINQNGQINAASIATGTIPTAALADASITASKINTAANTIPRTSVTSGSVLQVVSANYTTDSSYLSTTYTSVVGATITPTTATSKILVLYNYAAVFKSGNAEGEFSLYLNGNQLAIVDGISGYDGTTSYQASGAVAGSYLHSPASTSAQTYAMYIKSNNVSNVRINTEGGVSTITLLEIAA